MNKNELIGPETNLYGRPERVSMAGLAGVGEHPRIVKVEAGSQATQLAAEEVLDLSDYAKAIRTMNLGAPLEDRGQNGGELFV